MIDAFKVYKYFMAIKLHFTTDKYDLFEKNGRVSGSRSTFEKRNDRFLFQKFGNKFLSDQELIQFFVANFAYGNPNVIYGDEVESFTNYDEWRKRKESRTRFFQLDLLNVQKFMNENKSTFNSMFSVDDCCPNLLKLNLRGDVSIETMSIINDIENYLDGWQPLIMIWGEKLRLINKIKKFVRYDQAKIKSIYNNFKEEYEES